MFFGGKGSPVVPNGCPQQKVAPSYIHLVRLRLIRTGVYTAYH